MQQSEAPHRGETVAKPGEELYELRQPEALGVGLGVAYTGRAVFVLPPTKSLPIQIIPAERVVKRGAEI